MVNQSARVIVVNSEGDSKMSVTRWCLRFRSNPERTCMDWMLSAHRQADDEHSKIIGPIKVIAASSLINREWLKQGRCSKASWVALTGEQDWSLSRGPFLFGLVGSWNCAPIAGLSCSELFSKEWVRPCVAGEWEYSSVRWSRPRTVTGGTPVALSLMETHSSYETLRFWLYYPLLWLVAGI